MLPQSSLKRCELNSFSKGCFQNAQYKIDDFDYWKGLNQFGPSNFLFRFVIINLWFYFDPPDFNMCLMK